MNKNMKGSAKLSCSSVERERLPKITSTIKVICWNWKVFRTGWVFHVKSAYGWRLARGGWRGNWKSFCDSQICRRKAFVTIEKLTIRQIAPQLPTSPTFPFTFRAFSSPESSFRPRCRTPRKDTISKSTTRPRTSWAFWGDWAKGLECRDQRLMFKDRQWIRFYFTCGLQIEF